MGLVRSSGCREQEQPRETSAATSLCSAPGSCEPVGLPGWVRTHSKAKPRTSWA